MLSSGVVFSLRNGTPASSDAFALPLILTNHISTKSGLREELRPPSQTLKLPPIFLASSVLISVFSHLSSPGPKGTVFL